MKMLALSFQCSDLDTFMCFQFHIDVKGLSHNIDFGHWVEERGLAALFVGALKLGATLCRHCLCHSLSLYGAISKFLKAISNTFAKKKIAFKSFPREQKFF